VQYVHYKEHGAVDPFADAVLCVISCETNTWLRMEKLAGTCWMPKLVPRQSAGHHPSASHIMIRRFFSMKFMYSSK